MKAIIPAAGLGTRLLPASKSQPKEMLPVVDKPVIQYVVEEAVSSGIDEILIITGRGKRAIEDHFDKSFELEYALRDKGKEKDLENIKRISNLAKIHYIRQKDPRGLGDATYLAKDFVGREESFVVLLGDDIIVSEKPCTRQLLEVYKNYNEPVIAVQRVGEDRIHLYGAVEYTKVKKRLYLVNNIVEKPIPKEAPSRVATMGRYVLTPEIFECIKRVKPDRDREIQLSEALNLLLERRKLYAWEFEGKRYDVGNKLDWIKATIELSLMRSDLSEEVLRFIKSLGKLKV